MSDMPITHDFVDLPDRWGNGTRDVLETFEQNLIGRRIVKLEDQAMILDDGTRLAFIAGSDCCARGWIDSFKAIENLDQATITRVEEVELEEDKEFYEEHYRVTIFGGDRRLAELDHTIDHSNGYYTSAVEVEVIKGKPGRVVGAPKKGETYLYDEAGRVQTTVADEDHRVPADVLVPVAPAWPDKPVIVIDEGMRAGETLNKGVIAVREAGTLDYLDEYGNVWIANVDTITAWHEYVADGYAQVLRVTAGELAATSVTTSRLVAPRREYTADDLDYLPDRDVIWDDDDDPWVRVSTGFWESPHAGFSHKSSNPLRDDYIDHAYSAPEPGEQA